MPVPAPRLGSHMSIAGGMPTAVERAVSVGATALQVFVKSSNQWAARPFADGEVDAFRAAARDAGIAAHVVAHASYLINLASADDALWERSTEALGVEVERCAALGIPALVVHPGSPKDAGAEAGIDRVAAALDRVLGVRGAAAGRRAGVRVLLETTAGQGATLGRTFQELGAILERTRCPGRVGVCFDTCHALAAGYEFRTEAGYRRTFRDLDRAVGLSSLAAMHLNDSKFDLGSRKDRHEHIGRGSVGLDAFARIVNDRRFRGIPMVLETPKDEKTLAEDRVNLATLRGLVRR
jgi:deoxyribonuclease-4